MAYSKRRKKWLSTHISDPFVKLAQAQNYRSRAAFKLLQLIDKEKLIKPGMVVVDLGAAPGGWAQVAAHQVGAHGHVFAVDKLPIQPIAGVDCICGDMQTQNVIDSLLKAAENTPVDVVISDMAPNISGNRSVDQPRSMLLAHLAFNLAQQLLRQGGGLLIKVFQGEGLGELRQQVEAVFNKVTVRKPKASRPQSAEAYLAAKGYNLNKGLT
ncbi:MAG: RlmE family RNA methyltransferase [Gammaproteobacteria bacterium]